MFQNNNNAVIKHISKASLKSNKLRNRLVGSVITLAAFLMALVITFEYNAAMEMKNWMDYQAMFENADKQVIQRISKNTDVEVYGLGERVGIAKEGNTSLLMIYADENTMKLSNIHIKSGSMPKAANQIAIEESYFRSANKKLGIGDTIKLNYRNDISRRMQTSSFIITGLLEAGAESSVDSEAYNAVLSWNFIKADPALASVNPSVVIKVADADSYSNSELKAKIKQISKAAGLDEKNIDFNNLNIDSNNATYQTSLAVMAIPAVVMFACALVIYNIFCITIMRRVKEYGQLRTLGTTRRQIKKIVFREGKVISIRYIPLGIIGGCIVSYILRTSMWLPGPSTVLALSAGIITFIVVMISLRKPASIAAGASPMEALHYTGYNAGKISKERSARKLTPFMLGKLYLSRNKKKNMITFLSLTLSGILFITAASFLTSIDPDQRARRSFPYGGEYIISLNSDLISPLTDYNDLQIKNPLSEKLKSEITEISGVNGIEVHKYIKGRLPGVAVDDGTIEISNIREKDYKELEKLLTQGSMPEFSAVNNQMLINSSGRDYKNINFKPGSKGSLNVFDGKLQKKADFIISGIVKDKDSGETFLLPDKTMDKLVKDNCNISFEILSSKGYSANTESQLKALVERDERLEFKSFKEEKDSIENILRTITLTVYTFVAFIACFGLVNLVNTMITNVISRKNEIGILQAVGLNRTQLTQMLSTENAYMIFGSFIVSVVAGSAIGYAVSKSIGNIAGLSYIRYQAPLLIIAIYFLLIVVIQAVTTKFIGISMRKHSVVERMREI